MRINQIIEGYKQLKPAAVFNMPTTVFVSRKATPEQEQRVDDIPAWAADNGVNMALLRLVLNPLKPAFGRPIEGWRFRLPGQPFPLPPFKKPRTAGRGPKDGRYRVQKVGSEFSKVVTIRQWARDNAIKPADLAQAINKNIPIRDGLGREWMVSKDHDLAEARKKRLAAAPQETRDHVVLYNGFALQPFLYTKSETQSMDIRSSDVVMPIQDAFEKYRNDPYLKKDIYKLAMVAGIL